MKVDSVSTATSASSLHMAKFHGKTGDFYRIWIVNTLLTILTLGIYSAWAKVRNLKFFYGSTELAGSRFDFHGTPMAILKGRILAAIVGGLYFFGARIHIAVGLIGLLVLFFAVPWLIMKSFQFRMAYTSYRNLRFSFRGKIEEGYKLWFKFVSVPVGLVVLSTILSMVWGIQPTSDIKQLPLAQIGTTVLLSLSAAIYWLFMFPKFYTSAISFLYNHTYYGGSRAHIDADASSFNKLVFWPTGLRGIGAIALFLVGIFSALGLKANSSLFMLMMFGIFGGYIAIGLVALFYMFRRMTYVWNRLSLDGNSAHISMKMNEFCKIVITNMFAVGFSWGLLFPWAKIRYHKYIVESKGIHMDSFDRFVGDASQKISSLGEEASSVFDIDLEIGL